MKTPSYGSRVYEADRFPLCPPLARRHLLRHARKAEVGGPYPWGRGPAGGSETRKGGSWKKAL